jgi:LysR family transcriptional regulator, glycine cleavage system transcriptional activator
LRVPSTQTLRALESFARHASIWKVAEELSLTRSAVSHQLRQLERDLGFPLLRRAGRGVVLTARGRRYANDVRKALALIGDAGLGLDDRGIAGPLAISCVSGFAGPWLCPIIGAFQERYPEVALRILAPQHIGEVTNPEADLFITFGDGNWPHRIVELLSEVEYSPMCSAALLNRLGGFESPADLRRTILLHIVDVGSWSRWFSLAGLELPDPEAGIIFDDKSHLLAAMSAGQGVALGDDLTCGPALAAGQIVRPFDLAIKSLGAYYLVIEPRKAARPPVVAFRDWLRARLEGARRAPHPAA